MEISKNIEHLYGHKVRTRVCGVCFHNDSLLLVKHRGLGENGILWTPPGGGVQYGDTLENNLIREFREETGLNIAIVRFLFVYEYLGPPLQTIELFFEVKAEHKSPVKGTDPEMSETDQIIDEVRFVSLRELGNFASGSLHYMLRGLSKKEDLLHKSGLFKFEKN